jgi:hypothetical protein
MATFDGGKVVCTRTWRYASWYAFGPNYARFCPVRAGEVRDPDWRVQ